MNASSTQSMQTKKKRAGIIAPILLTAVGVGWLLTTQGVLPGVQWAWVLVLAVLGVLILALNGIDKFSIVTGPSLVAGTLLSFLRQSGWISIDTEIPVLAIVVGALWTAAQLVPLPLPSWIVSESPATRQVPRAETPLPHK